MGSLGKKQVFREDFGNGQRFTLLWRWRRVCDGRSQNCYSSVTLLFGPSRQSSAEAHPQKHSTKTDRGIWSLEIIWTLEQKLTSRRTGNRPTPMHCLLPLCIKLQQDQYPDQREKQILYLQPTLTACTTNVFIALVIPGYMLGRTPANKACMHIHSMGVYGSIVCI